jgi:hypothetical protein
VTTPDEARSAATAFVREEAGFAVVVTTDLQGYPVGRSMTAFLQDDWSVALVQRRSHRRLEQLRRQPRALVTWVGAPAPGATNERPHVFDIGRLPQRVVSIRGTTRFMSDAWTVARYREHVTAQRAQGFTRAPLRDDAQVAADLVGVLLLPHRVRLEGFGNGAEAFEWTVRTTTQGEP